MMFDREKIISDVLDKLTDKNELLYLSLSGSGLHGTATTESDVDVTGVFLPSKESCILNRASEAIRFSTGSDDSKNEASDVDTTLWSLQYWLKKVGEGECNAIDLLYSPSNKGAVLYDTTKLDSIFHYHYRLFNTASYEKKVFGITNSELGRLNSNTSTDQRWKGLSHALRHIHQYKHLFDCGEIMYPLSSAAFLRSIKCGEFPIAALEIIIRETLEIVHRFGVTMESNHWLDSAFVDRSILSLY